MKKIKCLVSTLLVSLIVSTNTVFAAQTTTAEETKNSSNIVGQSQRIPAYMSPGTVIKFNQNKDMEIVKKGTKDKNLSSKIQGLAKTSTATNDLPTIQSNMTVVYDALGAPVVITPQSRHDKKISVGMKEVKSSDLKVTSSPYANTQLGIVSWFNIWDESDTASGMKAADGAAHKTIPLRTYVEVDNLRNGKGYTVWILDRGPYVRGRILDMSEESFEKVEDLDKGLFNGQIFWN